MLMTKNARYTIPCLMNIRGGTIILQNPVASIVAVRCGIVVIDVV
jgi:hypothetical protein